MAFTVDSAVKLKIGIATGWGMLWGSTVDSSVDSWLPFETRCPYALREHEVSVGTLTR